MRSKNKRPVVLEPLTLFNKSLKDDIVSQELYYLRLIEYGISCIEWVNLPEEIDERFIEYTLLTQGQALFFKDDGLDQFLCLPATGNGKLNVYNIPINRRAYANNGYQRQLSRDNSVFIFNNYTHTNMLTGILWYSQQLSEIDMIMKINVRAMKTPLVISCDEEQRLTVENFYKEYDGNQALICTTKNYNPESSLKVFDTKAEFKGDKLYELKQNIWSEALTYLGIMNLPVNKKERVITDEIEKSQGAVYGERLSRVGMREKACKQINRMFGLDVSVRFNDGVAKKIKEEIQNE